MNVSNIKYDPLSRDGGIETGFYLVDSHINDMQLGEKVSKCYLKFKERNERSS